ncbi:MAG: cytochrome b [Thalassobaculum sp.]|uniref:cytochrome b n=1 Tax=Thalassobaculum sp. TaxID=2022740 RepID=UPI0032EF5712
MRPTQADGAAESYDAVSIAFHWITFLLVLAMFALALAPGVVKGSIELHKSLGFAVFALVVLRILWRALRGRAPDHGTAEPILLRLGAKAAHMALYALLLTAPVLGWLYLEAKAIDVHPFGISWIEMPSVIYYDRPLAMAIYGWKQVVVYALLALILLHAAAAIVYHSIIRKDAVLHSILPRRWRGGVAVLAALVVFAPGSGRAETSFDVNAFAAGLGASLAKSCPMADPGDIAAHDACRRGIGTGIEAGMRTDFILFGGQQSTKHWLKDKKTSVFRGDLFQDMYMSLYMYTGKVRVQQAPDGLTTVGVQAYFRNKLPAGRYPYPFWHAPAKWLAYEKANEIRFRMNNDGKVVFAYRADVGSDENRGPYEHVEHPYFLGEWMWRDNSGGAQPVVTLFSEMYSQDNPNLAALDDSYRKMAINFRDADCTVCHQPEGHRKMNKLTLLQTPYHAAAAIDAVLDEVRADKMPVDDYDDPKSIDTKLKAELLKNGEAFKQMLATADAWERSNNRPKARPASGH